MKTACQPHRRKKKQLKSTTGRFSQVSDRTAGSCCGPEKLLAGQRPAAGHDVHCAVVAVTVDATVTA